MPDKSIIMYGTNWCPDCIRAKRFLQKHEVEFTWINIDRDPEGEQYVLGANQGNRVVPTILFEDGSILAEPTNQQLAAKLGIGNP